MGRLLRSAFVVFGLVALLICQTALAEALYAAPGVRAPTLWVSFAGEMFSLAFILLLQTPFFPGGGPVKPAGAPLRGLAVVFGLMQLYPGIGAMLLGLQDAEAGDSAAMIAVGSLIALTAAGFIVVGLRGLLRSMAAVTPDPMARSARDAAE
jgi:hypothetical protein